MTSTYWYMKKTISTLEITNNIVKVLFKIRYYFLKSLLITAFMVEAKFYIW